MHGVKKEKGYIVIFMALSIVILFGFIGLAIDASRHMVINSELQNAADACALAAVSEVNGQPDALKRAALVGSFVGGTKNYKNFQKDLASISTINVTFSSSLNGLYQDSTSANYATTRFIKCTASSTSISNYFISLLGTKTTNLTATAIATVKQALSVCALPMAVFANSEDDAKDFGYSKDRTVITAASNSTNESGFFTWADITGTLGTTSLEPYSNAITAQGQCGALTQPGSCINIRTGSVSSLYDAWNTRFGLYKNGLGSISPTDALPDLTGYAYYEGSLPSSGVLSDYLNNRAQNRQKFQSSSGAYSTPLNVQNNFGASGRRLVAIPILSSSNTVNVDNRCSSNQRYLKGWACVLMLSPVIQGSDKAKVIYEGNASDASSPCKSFGIPGGDNGIGPLVPSLVY
jgi:hypothetical protein